MLEKREKILVVDDDSAVLDLIANQALKAAGYETRVVNDVNGALNELPKFKPDMIIASLHLPGLNARDLLAVLNSQNDATPVIVVAEQGQEQKVIQTFRLGATDTLQWPAQEPEVINVVERGLKQVRARREREQLSEDLRKTNEALRQRVEELVAMYRVGKAVTSVTDIATVFDNILENAINVTHADIGWLLVRDHRSRQFVLASYRNLPDSFSAFLNKPWDDGISSIVAKSEEPYSGVGETLVGRKIGFLGQSALIVPIKSKKQVIGLMIVMRKQPVAFLKSEQALLEALADYACISMVNAYLLLTAEERAKRLQISAEFADLAEKVTNSNLQMTKNELIGSLNILRSAHQNISSTSNPKWSDDQLRALNQLQREIKLLAELATNISSTRLAQRIGVKAGFKINEVIDPVVKKMQPIFNQNAIVLDVQLPLEEILISGYPCLVEIAVEGIIGFALRICKVGGEVKVQMKESGKDLLIYVDSENTEITTAQIQKALQNPSAPLPVQGRRFSGLSGDLSVVQDCIAFMKGELSVTEADLGGTRFIMVLPINP
jgi:FixJ family two-component response regulator/signal transduction histidine kinase